MKMIKYHQKYINWGQKNKNKHIIYIVQKTNVMD